MRFTLWSVLVAGIAVASPAEGQDKRFPEPVAPAMDGVLGSALNLPERFTPRPEADPVSFGDRICPIEYQDDRDGTVLRLVRSVSSKITRVEGDRRITEEVSYGDYWISADNQYGVSLGRALRVDCVTSKAIGIVARFH
jgi:hypothetical protein